MISAAPMPAVRRRILGQALEGAAPARVAVDVDGGAEIGAGALGGLFGAERDAVEQRVVLGEGSGDGDAGGELRHVGEQVGDAGRSILVADARDAQLRIGGGEEHVGHRGIRALAGAVALHERDVVRNGHLREQHVDAVRDGQARVEPGAVGRVADRPGNRRLKRCQPYKKSRQGGAGPAEVPLASGNGAAFRRVVPLLQAALSFDSLRHSSFLVFLWSFLDQQL